MIMFSRRAKNRAPSGFSIVELALVTVIAAFLFIKGSQFFIRDTQNGDLNSTRDLAVNFLQRARSLANTNSKYVGVTFASQKITIFEDTNKNGMKDVSENPMHELTFRGEVKILDGCGANAIETTSNSTVIFNQYGFAGYVSGSVFNKKSYQLFLYHPLLDAGTRARELEILASGLVEKIPAGQAGFVTSNARQANKNGQDCGT